MVASKDERWVVSMAVRLAVMKVDYWAANWVDETVVHLVDALVGLMVAYWV